MLRNVPSIIDPELLYTLACMGHGDQIVIADDYYPAKSKTKSGNVLYAKGVDAVELIEAILKVMPLDADFSEFSIRYMVSDGPDSDAQEVHQMVIDKVGSYYSKETCGPVKRSDFYGIAERAFATVSTGEKRPYGCFILQKGVK